MTLPDAALGLVVGIVSGALAGLFGIGGGIVMQPGIQVLLGTTPIVAVGTALPVIFPTAVAGAITYRRAGQLDVRAAAWMAGPGLIGAAAGAAVTDVIDARLLLVAAAVLLANQAVSILRGAPVREADAPTSIGRWTFSSVGFLTGVVSGLLGVGGGLVMVPLLTRWLGVPLKRALGTSLLTIAALVVPGTLVHAALGHVDWSIVGVLIVGSVPGALIGARLGLGTRERTLRLLVGSFLLAVAVAYGARELAGLLST